ncbi:hypothetical protein BVC80_9077g54 [Macleaya cordata]|uniref:MORF/ORRM1/DAG-like MORF domain-containing protein n=1 Tax=Macleaya cordata TaxID=56857 RepID=A0A200PLP4_MACCD|nr:hypothetical protein BVC80_9077g54 [Macleaya cordata]
MIPRRALISLKQQSTTAATRKTNNSISRFGTPISSATQNPNPNPNLFCSSFSQNQKKLSLRGLLSHCCSHSPVSIQTKNDDRVLGVRGLSSQSTNYSSNKPPKETTLDGVDFQHWLVVMELPIRKLSHDDIIDIYIKTLAQVLGSEEEARKQIYSVSTSHYFAFGCTVSEEISIKIKKLPGVQWVLRDPLLDVGNKSNRGVPDIHGCGNERSSQNDSPRNFDERWRRASENNRDNDKGNNRGKRQMRRPGLRLPHPPPSSPPPPPPPPRPKMWLPSYDEWNSKIEGIPVLPPPQPKMWLPSYDEWNSKIEGRRILPDPPQPKIWFPSYEWNY